MSNLTSFTAVTPPTLPAGPSRGADAWRGHADVVAFSPALVAVRTDAISVQQSIHNSMNPMGAASVNSFSTGRRVYAAKQAAPPRGRYR